MFRFETLVVAVLLGSPVAALWLRGDFTDTDVWWRFGLCWLVAWAAVSVISAAARPIAAKPSSGPADEDPSDTDDTHRGSRGEGSRGEGSHGDETSATPAPSSPTT